MNAIEKILRDVKTFKKESEEVDKLIRQIEHLHEQADKFILQMIGPNLELLNTSLRKYYERSIEFYPDLKRLLPYTLINIVYIPGIYYYEIDASVLKKAHVKYVIDSDKFDTNVLIEYVRLIVEDLNDEIEAHGWKM